MRLMRVIGLVTVVGLALGLLPVPPGAAQVKIPPDFALEKAKESPGEVVFSHDKHKAKVEKCAACHTKVFKLKKGTTGVATMDQMKAGQQCGACHDGKTQVGGTVVFAVDAKDKCETCHRRK